MTTAEDGGKATVREVYQLVDRTRTDLANQVDEVRKELIDRVGSLTAGVNLLSTSQEHRLTSLEQSSEQHHEDIADHSKRIGDLEIAHQRALGHIGAWKLAGGIFGGAATIVIADLVFKMLGG